jgi:hypothetical protein
MHLKKKKSNDYRVIVHADEVDRMCSYLKEWMGVQFDTVLKPGYVRAWNTLCLTVKCQLPTENVFRFEVRRVYHFGSL